MLDQMRAKCGLNGRKSNSVWNMSFISLLKVIAYRLWVLSMISPGCYSVRKEDGVSFRDLISNRTICFGLCHDVNFLCIKKVYFYEKSGGSYVE